MRHQKTGRHLGRTSSHRVALRRNLAKALFTHGRIITTVTKAKEIRPFVERLITLARKAFGRKGTDRPAYVHYYREILSQLQDKALTQKLVGEGQWTASDVSAALKARSREKGGPTAPACGLYLAAVIY